MRLIINGMPYELHYTFLSDYAIQFHNPHINGQVFLDDIINVNNKKCPGKITGEISFNLALKDQDKIVEPQVKLAQFLSNFK